jgi:hypothetical protein
MMKKLLAMFALAVAMTGNAYATETNSGNDLLAAVQVQAATAGVVMNSVDMQAAFQQDAQPMQMAALSGQEMKATEGAWAWMVPFAAVFFAANYVWGQTTNSQKDRTTSNNIANAGRALCVVHPGACVSWLPRR